MSAKLSVIGVWQLSVWYAHTKVCFWYSGLPGLPVMIRSEEEKFWGGAGEDGMHLRQAGVHGAQQWGGGTE